MPMVHSSVDRSAIMRAVKGRDTGPEKAVRKLLWSMAPGYRLHRSDVPGKPDVTYVNRKRAIFVHGCFWHGHNCSRGARRPKTNIAYWTTKITGNCERDRKVRRRLRRCGWKYLIIWECQIRNLGAVKRRLENFLTM
jgi:DNA mismatch endonuclease, patch repair protein